MRDAFGGAFMIRLLIVFIVIYVGFTAIALNYAKAFKVKNKVITYIEENEITDIRNMSAEAYNNMNTYFQEELVEGMNYKYGIKCPNDKYLYDYCDNGILIIPSDSTGKNKEGTYYTVTTTFGWEIPFLNVLLRLNSQDGDAASGYWTITGETRPIVNK